MRRRTGEGRRAALLAAALAVALAPALARAAPSRFTAAVDRTELGVDETLELELQLETVDPVEQVAVPGLSDAFEIVSRRESGGSTYSLGGGGGVQFGRMVVLSYTLRPRRQGTLTVPAAVATIKGKAYQTAPVAVKVGPPRKAQGGSYAYSGWEKDVRLEVQLDRREAWLGEQVTASIWLLSTMGIAGYDRFSPPRYDGFWVEELDTPRTLDYQVREVNGIPTRAYLLQRLALFPTRAGTLTLPAAELDGIGVQLSGSSFDPFPEIRRLSRSSAPVSVEVKPLPAGAPPGFAPVNVGTLTLTATAPERAVAGEPIAIRLTASGEGNVRSLSLPRLAPVDGARAFEPTTRDAPSRTGQRLSGARTLETMIVPERPGALDVPPVEWSFFDPVTGRYQLARTAPLHVDVEPARGGAPAPAAGTNALAAGLRPIRAEGALSRRGPPPWQSPWFAAALAAPPLLLLALALAARLQVARPAARRAGRGAERRLAAARRRLARGDRDGFLGEVERALLHYAGDRLGRPAGGLTREALAAALSAAGAHAPAVRALLAALDAVELSRYGAGSARAEQVLESAQQAIDLLEEADWRREELAS